MLRRSWSRLWADEDGLDWYLARIDFQGWDLVDEFWVCAEDASASDASDAMFPRADFIRTRSRWWTDWSGSQWHLSCIHLTADLMVVEIWERDRWQPRATSDNASD